MIGHPYRDVDALALYARIREWRSAHNIMFGFVSGDQCDEHPYPSDVAVVRLEEKEQVVVRSPRLPLHAWIAQ